MSFIRRSTSAIGKLVIVVILAATFLFGMVGVVYLSLQGEEIKVPEIIGKDFVQSEKELTDLGLRIKKRADRFSQEKPNTILEQLPKPGETVKSGQMILVVTSKTNPEGEETPAVIKKDTEKEDTEKIEEMISDKPKKTNKSNSNTAANKKKSSTTRDVLTNNSNSNSNSTDKTNSNSDSSSGNKNSTTPTNKTTNPSDTKKPPTDTTKPNKPTTPGSGDSRQRKTP